MLYQNIHIATRREATGLIISLFFRFLLLGGGGGGGRLLILVQQLGCFLVLYDFFFLLATA